jgi:hypothetical protein
MRHNPPASPRMVVPMQLPDPSKVDEPRPPAGRSARPSQALDPLRPTPDPPVLGGLVGQVVRCLDRLLGIFPK